MSWLDVRHYSMPLPTRSTTFSEIQHGGDRHLEFSLKSHLSNW